tara:strand:- start:435 stop:1100 length:666 start_codon:yes stop_codon:yes gene_type:complete
MQRLFDIFFSSFAIFLLSPLLITVILLLKFSGEGQIFFLQNRIGHKKKVFKLYKFVTMLKNSENIGTGTVTLHNDPRILPVGHFLRKSKINELPQLFNVLRGEMSVIGPRPQTQRCFDAYPEVSQEEIIKVRPGLSGIGSIVFRNEDKMMHADNEPDKLYDRTIMPYKGVLEQWYVSHQGVWAYFCLIVLTIWVILTSNTNLIWKLFKNLPHPPEELKDWL